MWKCALERAVGEQLLLVGERCSRWHVWVVVRWCVCVSCFRRRLCFARVFFVGVVVYVGWRSRFACFLFVGLFDYVALSLVYLICGVESDGTARGVSTKKSQRKKKRRRQQW